MKKILTTIVALAISSAFAVDVKPLNPKTSTLEDYKAAIALALAKTNNDECAAIILDSKFASPSNPYIGKFSEEDAILSARGVAVPPSANLVLPLTWNKKNRPSLVANQPTLLSLVEKYNVPYASFTIFWKDVEYCDTFAWLRFWVFEMQIPRMELFDLMSSYVQKKAIKTIRKYLRKNGKGFVTVNGVNPCEKYLKELADGLNSPRLEGFVKWLSVMGVDDKIDVSWIPSAKEIEALKNRILDADEELTPKSQKLLRIGLGSDGYNAFVKEYNGEK